MPRGEPLGERVAAAEALDDALPDSVAVSLPLGDADAVPLPVAEAVSEPLSEPLPLALPLRVGEGEVEAVSKAEPLREPVPVPDLVAERDGVPVLVPEADAVPVRVAEPLVLPLPVLEPLPETLPVPLPLALAVGVLDAEAPPESDAVAVADVDEEVEAVGVLEGVAAGVPDALAVGERVTGGVPVAVPVCVADSDAGALEPEPLAVKEPLCDPVGDALVVAERLPLPLGDADAVTDAGGVPEFEGVGERVPDVEGEGERVRETLDDRVVLTDGEPVAGGDGVCDVEAGRVGHAAGADVDQGLDPPAREEVDAAAPAGLRRRDLRGDPLRLEGEGVYRRAGALRRDPDAAPRLPPRVERVDDPPFRSSDLIAARGRGCDRIPA